MALRLEEQIVGSPQSVHQVTEQEMDDHHKTVNSIVRWLLITTQLVDVSKDPLLLIDNNNTNNTNLKARPGLVETFESLHLSVYETFDVDFFPLLPIDPNSNEPYSIQFRNAFQSSSGFLLRNSVPWIFTRIVYHFVEYVLEREKHYNLAILFFRILLSSPCSPSKRGYWWIRLITDLEHQDRSGDALLICEKLALNDQLVSRADRETLQKKAIKLSKPPRRWSTPKFDELKECPTITIQGTLTHSEAGRKNKYLSGEHLKEELYVEVNEMNNI